MGCLENPIFVSGFVLYNVLYYIMKKILSSMGVGMTSRTMLQPHVLLCRLIYLCVFWIDLIYIKAFVDTTNW